MSKLPRRGAQACILFGSLDFFAWLKMCNIVKFSHWEDKTKIFFSKVRVWRYFKGNRDTLISPQISRISVTVSSSIIKTIIIVASGSQNMLLTDNVAIVVVSLFPMQSMRGKYYSI